MIVLTGGAGFIGSAFLWKLNQMGISDVVVVDELGSSEKWLNLTGKKFAEYMEKEDLLDALAAGKIPDVKFIVHMGACSDTTCDDAHYFIRNNYEYSKSLTEWAMSNQVPFIYASSAATYGDGSVTYSDREEFMEDLRPLNMYAFSKHMFDMWLKRKGILNKVTGIKFFNVFGPNEYHKGPMQSVVCKAFPQVRDEGKIKLFKSYDKSYADGEQKRDFIYIKDAVEVMEYFFLHPEKTGIYNLGTGRARSWNDLAKSMFRSLGKEPDIEYVDMPRTLRPKYQYFTQADLTRLRKCGCDHEFMSLEDSVFDYISGYLIGGKTL